MNDTHRFEQNPAGINQVLIVLPGHISFNFNPVPLCRHPSMSGSSETVLILAGHCFSLLGDFRESYERTLAIGGVEACLLHYLDLCPIFGGPCSSPRDPWEMLALALADSSRSQGAATSGHATRVMHEMALAE